jgi:hypothetical protein
MTMRYTPISTQLRSTALAKAALATAGVAAVGLGALHVFQNNPTVQQAVGEHIPVIGPMLANMVACGCPFCTGQAAVCRGNEAFSTDELARYDTWSHVLGNIK